MFLVYLNESYECSVAVKCEHNRYIKLYDANGEEIASFTDIADFSEYNVTGGSFTTPASCKFPILATNYIIGGATIGINDWKKTTESTYGSYEYEIKNPIISANAVTCNIFLNFKFGTVFDYTAVQREGSLTLYTHAIPEKDIEIENIQVVKA